MMKKSCLSLLLIIATLSLGHSQDALYLDTSQSLDARVEGLISRLTLEEKVKQMMNSTPAITRFDISAYEKSSNDRGVLRLLQSSCSVK